MSIWISSAAAVRNTMTVYILYYCVFIFNIYDLVCCILYANNSRYVQEVGLIIINMRESVGHVGRVDGEDGYLRQRTKG